MEASRFDNTLASPNNNAVLTVKTIEATSLALFTISTISGSVVPVVVQIAARVIDSTMDRIDQADFHCLAGPESVDNGASTRRSNANGSTE